MTDPTARRSAGMLRSAWLDPARPSAPGRERDRAAGSPDEPAIEAPRDVTAGRSSGTSKNAEQDPTRGRSAGTSKNAEQDPTRGRSAGRP